MATRGVLRTSIPPSFTRGVVLRATGGPSILKELSNEKIAVDVEDVLRLNVAGLAATVFIGGQYETQTVHNLTRLVDLGNRHGIPVIAVTGVVDEAMGDAKYFRVACRICAELSAHFVKTYFVDEDFDSVVGCCPVPVVVAGGKKFEV
jgi:putative autoinducer-2 (AI-2) aldolase